MSRCINPSEGWRGVRERIGVENVGLGLVQRIDMPLSGRQRKALKYEVERQDGDEFFSLRTEEIVKYLGPDVYQLLK